jgi:hypothetical protein
MLSGWPIAKVDPPAATTTAHSDNHFVARVVIDMPDDISGAAGEW